ncbi:hypothetical protein QP178_19645 [Sphingomonas aurantiaca]|uniref:hypothetical protein n=1 Tax=Sphingomonas aurantiaca TaxID=185949 RepID=UPI002FE03CC6
MTIETFFTGAIAIAGFVSGGHWFKQSRDAASLWATIAGALALIAFGIGVGHDLTMHTKSSGEVVFRQPLSTPSR